MHREGAAAKARPSSAPPTRPGSASNKSGELAERARDRRERKELVEKARMEALADRLADKEVALEARRQNIEYERQKKRVLNEQARAACCTRRGTRVAPSHVVSKCRSREASEQRAEQEPRSERAASRAASEQRA